MGVRKKKGKLVTLVYFYVVVTHIASVPSRCNAKVRHVQYSIVQFESGEISLHLTKLARTCYTAKHIGV